MMHSMTQVMIGLLVVIVVLGGLLVALRVHAGHEVEDDHPSHR